MGTFHWFCTPPYVSLNFIILQPWQIPTHHAVLLPQNHTAQTGTLAVSSQSHLQMFHSWCYMVRKILCVLCISILCCSCFQSDVGLWVRKLYFFASLRLFCFMAAFRTDFTVNVAPYTEAVRSHRVKDIIYRLNKLVKDTQVSRYTLLDAIQTPVSLGALRQS